MNIMVTSIFISGCGGWKNNNNKICIFFVRLEN